MVQRIKRIRAGSAEPRASAKLTKSKTLLKSISIMITKRDELDESIKALSAELEEAMKSGKISSVEIEEATAAMVRSSGKAQNIIDPKKLYSKVSEADFFSSVSVLVTKAKELLGQKELDKITSTIPAKLGEEKLKITVSK